MNGRENRKQRREAERKARKLANKQDNRRPLLPFVPEQVDLTPLPPQRNLPARLLEMRAQAERELEEEFGADVLARGREIADRIARRSGAYVPHRSDSQTSRPETPALPAALPEAKPAGKSTGPRTPEGKLASSRNSLKHGLSTGTLLIPGEDRAAFESLRDALLGEHQPANTTEELLVAELSQSYWLLQRAIRFQNECFTENGVDEKRLALFLRYGTTHQRAFHKALNTLIRLKKDRLKEERRKTPSAPSNDFVSQKCVSPSPQPPPLEFVSQNSPSAPSQSTKLNEIGYQNHAANRRDLSNAA